MQYLDGTKEQFLAFMGSFGNGPVQMVNFLKFKEEVDGKSGEEQYNIYMKAATPYLEKSGAKVLFYGQVQATLIGPADTKEWDKVIIVEYPSPQHFAGMATAPDYPNHLRRAALEDSRLFACKPNEL
jgi:uncharacterized protein (DUF1330 family)